MKEIQSRMKKNTILHIKRCILLFGAVLLFTFFDWVLHQSNSALDVPSWYFTNKIMYGTLWACVTSFFVQKYSLKIQAVLITVITVSLLQIRYLLYGYPLEFHAIIFPAHLVLLYFAVYAALYIKRKKSIFPKH